MTNSNISQRDIALGILVVALWAMHTVVIKMIMVELEPVTALMIRLTLSSLIFVPFIRWPGKKRFILLCQIAALMAVLHWGTLFWALERLGAGMSVIIMQTQIIFSIGWGILLFGERIGWRSGVGVGMGLLGVIVLVAPFFLAIGFHWKCRVGNNGFEMGLGHGFLQCRQCTNMA